MVARGGGVGAVAGDVVCYVDASGAATIGTVAAAPQPQIAAAAAAVHVGVARDNVPALAALGAVLGAPPPLPPLPHGVWRLAPHAVAPGVSVVCHLAAPLPRHHDRLASVLTAAAAPALLDVVVCAGATLSLTACLPPSLTGGSATGTVRLQVARVLPTTVPFVRITRTTRLAVVPPPSPLSPLPLQPPPLQPPSEAAPSPFGGAAAALAFLDEYVIAPLAAPAAARTLRVGVPSGILLHGPPGVGKTRLVQQLMTRVAAALPGARTQLTVVAGAELLSGAVGATEARLRHLFDAGEAFLSRSGGAPALAVLFLDEADALAPRRAASARAGGGGSPDGASPALVRALTQLLTLMDAAAARVPHRPPGTAFLVVAATNRPDALDPALRRPGRLERELRLHPPDEADRAAILAAYTRHLPLAPDAAAALPHLAHRTVGYVGADLAAVVREAVSLAAGRAAAAAAAATSSTGTPLPLTAADLDTASCHVRASALRGVAASHDTTRWEDVGGMGDVVHRLRAAVEYPRRHAAAYRAMALAPPRGVLLYGPPGNSKTTLVRALACSMDAAFFVLSGADLMSPYVGEAEATVRALFARAREAVPAIIFLDEVDALVGSRGRDGVGATDGGAAVGILASLLTELDGVASADGVTVVAATNRKEALDPALMRPGRLELHLHVPPPDAAGRAAILAIHTRAARLEADVDLPALAAATPGWSGAALANLAREAAMEALRESLAATAVARRHFDAALAALAAESRRG